MTLLLNGTNGVSDVDGTAATPAIRGTDTNTGIFFPAADTIAFAEGGAEIARFDSSGNLGIGTSSPATKLDVTSTGANGINITSDPNTTTDSGMLFFSSTGGTYSMRNSNGSLLFSSGATAGSSSGTERMRINESGDVSIIQAAGRHTIDTSGGATTIANNGTVDFPNASGMLVVNNHSSGHITIWLCGSGNTSAIGSVGGTVGSLSYVAGINGYRWTNNYGASAIFGFFFVRTRTGA